MKPLIKYRALLLLCATALWLEAQTSSTKQTLSAPTFYIALGAPTCQPDSIRVSGASNLPAGSIMLLVISDFNQNAWKDYSNQAFVTLREDGFFSDTLHPKQGLTFRSNLLAQAYFSPVYVPPKQSQPQSVLQAVGRRGENLGGLKNPQSGQLSGPNYYLTTIARVPYCGEHDNLK